MQLSTLGVWGSFLVGVVATGLTASPTTSFLALPLAFLSSTIFLGFVLYFLFTKWQTIVVFLKEPLRMIVLGLGLIFIGFVIIISGTYRLGTLTNILSVPQTDGQPPGTTGFPLAVSSGPGGQLPVIDGRVSVNYLNFIAYNIGKSEIQLKRIILISGATGAVRNVKLLTDVGEIDISEANPVPPGAQFPIMAYFGDEIKHTFMYEDEFLKDWTPFTLEISYDNQVQRILVSRAYMNDIFNAQRPNQGPRVTKRN